jgi:alkylhydroperoxidase/carboxymuconolactone decarboxylase family protein YurZ
MEAKMNLESEERVTELDPVFGPMGIQAGKQIWSDAALSAREKAVVLIAADVCVPELGLPFELHIGMAVKHAEMSAEDIRELLRHLAPLAGFNIVAMAFQRALEVLQNLQQDTRSSAEPRLETAQVYGGEAFDELRRVDPVLASDIERTAAQLWPRERLSQRERCYAALAVDVIGQTLDGPFKEHLLLCHGAGLSKDDCASAVRMLAEFSGPKAWQARLALERLFPTKEGD